VEAAEFLAQTGAQRIGRLRKRLGQAAANPGSEDAVHDLRVAVRRVLAWIAAWESVVGPAPGLQRARRSLKNLMSPLGRLRDAHVKREWIRRRVPTGDTASYRYAILVQSDVIGWEAKVRDLLGQRWPARIRIEVPTVRTRSRSGSDPKDEGRRLLETLANDVLRHRVDALDPADTAALHRMRLAFKRYRYSWEIFSPCFAGAGQATAKRYQALQTLLGTIHDCDVILREARWFRERVQPSARESVLEASFRRLRDEKFSEFRRIADSPRGLSRLLGPASLR
jgi:CHAD domain-containing protein